MTTNTIFSKFSRYPSFNVFSSILILFVIFLLIFPSMDELKNDLLSAGGAENADIQNKLYAWFEEKGHVNKMRAYFREQLIAALKDGCAWNVVNKPNVTSPKTQAVNLLIADFLLSQEHLYTLSVFVTEVPLLGNLYRFSSYVNSLGTDTQTTPVVKHNYRLDEVRDILETLGFRPDSEVVQLTCQYYFDANKDNVLFHSLLLCLFKALTSIKNDLNKCDKIRNNENISNKSFGIERDTSEYRLNNWLMGVEDILSSFNLNEGQRNILKNLLKKYQQNNNSQEITYYKECLKKLERLNKEMVEKVADVEQMVFQREHIENVTKKLRLEQKQLNKLINICEEKENSLRKLEEVYNTKLQDIENHKQELSKKEIEILKREKMLKEEPSKHVDQETTVDESSYIKLLQEQNVVLTKQLQEIKLNLDELKEYKTKQTSSNKINNDTQKIETSLDREMVRKLQQENNELREFIQIQRHRIEELSNRASNLTNQIEKTHKILPTTTMDYNHMRTAKKRINFLDNAYSKKNYNKKQNISSTTGTDYSTTLLESDNQTEDDMIKKARSRLKVLEKNTEEVEQNLNFQKKNFLTNRTHHNKVMQISSRKSYNKIRSHLSDDSDVSPLKSASNRINLKELANKIGYHRSVRRSIINSESENDTSLKTVRNHINVTNNSSIKISSDIHNDIYKDLSVNNSKIESFPINKVNHYTEFPTNISDMSVRKSNNSPSKIEMTALDNRLLTNSPKPSNIENQMLTKTADNIETKNHVSQPVMISDDKRSKENVSVIVHDTQQIPITVVQQDTSNEIDTSLTSKKEDHESAISFGSSNKTDRSSDFWA